MVQYNRMAFLRTEKHTHTQKKDCTNSVGSEKSERFVSKFSLKCTTYTHIYVTSPEVL